MIRILEKSERCQFHDSSERIFPNSTVNNNPPPVLYEFQIHQFDRKQKDRCRVNQTENCYVTKSSCRDITELKNWYNLRRSRRKKVAETNVSY